MAQHKSAKKRIRRNAHRSAINRVHKSRVRTLIKRVETAIANGDKEQANSAMRAAQPVIHSGVSKGVLHRNTAGRRLSRLSALIKAI